MSVVRDAVSELIAIFRRNTDKREANRLSAPLMDQISREPRFIAGMLATYLESPESLDRGNYPALRVPIDLNPWFSLDANCWIPLPDGNTNLSTKAIHHHGKMLLTTVTLFGPGYEHWTFKTPVELDSGKELYAMDLIEAAPHPRHHVAFVDSFIPHTPFFPPALSITLALFSNLAPTTWRDHAKRLPVIRGREETLRRVASRVGLGRALDLKVVESFDYYPTADGFRVMKQRKEFELGPVADHVTNLLHVLQQTANEHLAPVIRNHLDSGRLGPSRSAVEALLPALERGVPIEPRLSKEHYDRFYANFSHEDIHRALDASRKGPHGRQLAASPTVEEVTLSPSQ